MTIMEIAHVQILSSKLKTPCQLNLEQILIKIMMIDKILFILLKWCHMYCAVTQNIILWFQNVSLHQGDHCI